MNQEQRSQFDNLIANHNFLGAYVLAKELHLDKVAEAVLIGELSNAIVQSIKSVPRNSEEETLYRAQLSYVLRDYPGLSQLYREFSKVQRTEPNLIDSVGKAFKKASDMATGKVDFEAEIKENFEHFDKQASEAGLPFGDLLKQAGKSIQGGLSQANQLFSQFLNESAAKKDETKPSATDEEGRTIKVNIQKDDKPLPPDIEKTGDV